MADKYRHLPFSRLPIQRKFTWYDILSEARHYTFKYKYSDSEILDLQLLQYPIFMLTGDVPKQRKYWLDLLTTAPQQSIKILHDKSLPTTIRRAYCQGNYKMSAFSNYKMSAFLSSFLPPLRHKNL